MAQLVELAEILFPVVVDDMQHDKLLKLLDDVLCLGLVSLFKVHSELHDVAPISDGNEDELIDAALVFIDILNDREGFALNTIGLANLIYGRDVTPELKGRFDTVSISLNAPDEKEFLELTRSKFGIQSYEAIKEFAVLSKQYVPNVVMTVVEKVMPEEKIQKCQEICDTLGVTLRVRPFEN